MTEEEQARRDAEAIKLMDLIDSNLPEELSDEAVVAICNTLISSYAPDARAAGLWVMTLAQMVADSYRADTGGECMCDNCVTERKRNAN